MSYLTEINWLFEMRVRPLKVIWNIWIPHYEGRDCFELCVQLVHPSSLPPTYTQFAWWSWKGDGIMQHISHTTWNKPYGIFNSLGITYIILNAKNHMWRSDWSTVETSCSHTPELNTTKLKTFRKRCCKYFNTL